MRLSGRRQFQAEVLANAKLVKWGQQKRGGQSGCREKSGVGVTVLRSRRAWQVALRTSVSSVCNGAITAFMQRNQQN